MFIQVGVPCKWTSDSQRFLLKEFDTICQSPSSIYHSILPSSPSSSWFHKSYGGLQEVKAAEGLPAGWGPCSRTVLLDSNIQDLSYWNNTVAIGSRYGDIIILNAITGSQTAALSGHTGGVNSLTFSLDGRSLVSGSDDTTVKLWDVQTGGIVKTFHGHTNHVHSVSISADNTIIASGSSDKTARLWDIQTGECHVIEQYHGVYTVSFSPRNPQYLLSICDSKLWQWDINGHPVGPTYNGSHVSLTSDGTQFVSCEWTAVTVRDSSSGATVAEFHVANDKAQYCCFSPDGRLVAVAAGSTAYIWDITGLVPHLSDTFIGHTEDITSLVFSFPSSLISASQDQSVKFWRISASSASVGSHHPEPIIESQLQRPLRLPPPNRLLDTLAPQSSKNREIKPYGHQIKASLVPHPAETASTAITQEAHIASRRRIVDPGKMLFYF